MEKFEYKKVDFQKLTRPHHSELDVNKLNELGAEGWELVMIDSGEYVFKRKIV
ncbi:MULTISPECIES: DUF4177 domain-containing protein [Bacillus]|uniref:DUF4177 domain-containing protein n=1 Tax=Bacillus TaxID=1386 RepID=UPI000AF5AE03|nr:DUF4177 domain-containing protein [Bacillus cereus]